jgi:hypothetical protein
MNSCRVRLYPSSPLRKVKRALYLREQMGKVKIIGSDPD